MRLQVQQIVDEEAVRRFGADYERDVKRSAYKALADKMLEAECVTETVIHPDAKDEQDVPFHPLKRFYRFSVVVGHQDQTRSLVEERKAGRREAIKALHHILKGAGDYDGELRGYFDRWLEKLPDAAIDYAVEEMAKV